MNCGQYMYPDDLPRKSFLTPAEEEELIRRLYIRPRLNVFPTKLYEDLPPLKFWNSPSSVIECYLQRKVFQKRLQLAYEFNQSKEPHDHMFHTHDHMSHHTMVEGQEQLTKAVNQLADDIHFYSNSINKLFSNESIKTQGSGDRNKELWDEIRPEETFTPPKEEYMITEHKKKLALEPKFKLRDDIKKRFSDYKTFYRLQNLRSDNKRPLALTIDEKSQDNEASLSRDETISKIVSQEELSEKEKQSIHPYSVKSEELSEYSTDFETSIDYTDIMSNYQDGSENILEKTTKIQNIFKNVPPVNDDLDSLLPKLPLDTTYVNNFNRRGTMLTLKDSVELARKRMSSKYSRFSMANDLADYSHQQQTHMANYKDSYMMLTDKLPKVHHESFKDSNELSGIYFDSCSLESSSPVMKSQRNTILGHGSTIMGHRNTILGHQDSLLLALNRISSKERTEELDCDICNNRKSKSIQFLCDFHASSISTNMKPAPSTGILSKSKSYVSHRDSVEIAKKRGSLSPSLKQNRKSIGCQINEISITGGMPEIKDEIPKGSKMSKQNEENVKSENVKKSPTKLKNYLMSAVQINQVVTHDSSSK